MSLTPKQEAFCKGIADGLGQAAAYRAAYNAENMKDSTIYSRASELMADRKIAERVNTLKAKVVEKQLWTREMSVKALIAAYKEGKGAVKVNAVKELNAMHGYNEPTKHDVKARIIIVDESD